MICYCFSALVQAVLDKKLHRFHYSFYGKVGMGLYQLCARIST